MPTLRRATWMLAAAVLVTGCGSDEDYANKPRPPAPINVTASIGENKITVSPPKFGAGPVVFIIANQSEQPQRVTLQTDEIGGSQAGIKQTTSPINPRGTATLKVDLREGDYEVSVSGSGVRPATLNVEGERESAQNELLQP